MIRARSWLPALALVLGSAQTPDTARTAGVLVARDDGAASLARLSDPDPVRAREAWDRLVAGGGTTADLCLSGFEREDAAARRLRAALLVATAEGRHAAAVRERVLPDPDPSVRASGCRFLGRLDLADLELEARLGDLARVAREDAVRDVREAALRALSAIDSPEALDILGAIAARGAPEDRVLAAQALPEGMRAWPVVRELVLAGFRSAAGARTDDAVLAQLLPLYGRLLADQPGAGESTPESAPMVLALRHAAAEVREAGRAAFERLLGRLRELGEAERAGRLLEGLAAQGLDSRLVHYHRARLAFYPGGDLDAARSAALALRGAHSEGSDPDSRLWTFRSHYLEAMASLGAGRAAEASQALERAGAVLDGLLALRRDLHDEESRLAHLEGLLLRALVGIGRLLTELGDPAAAGETALVERAREVHQNLLEAQLGYARLGLDLHASLDGLLDAELSPFRLLFTGLDLPGLDVRTAIDRQLELGRLLATVAPVELPGFEGHEPLQDPLADPARKELLVEILFARLDELGRRIDEQREALARQPLELPGQLPSPEQLFELQVLRYRRSELHSALEDLDGEGARALRELRVPSSLALWVARDMRNEGRTVEARRLATAMREDLEREGTLHAFFWGLEMQAEIEMAIGNSWTDEDEPRRAEEELLGAVARLEDIEQRLQENGAGERQIEHVRALRSSALVSLAVNANVKLGDPERALGYYERAYALRQDEFMRVLLACYRARSGRAAEARALLREVRPGPQVYYNLACTHALLGDRERALDYLERELIENHFSPGSLDRQKDWARSDPDLAALREDPRFRHLVGPD